MIDTNIVMAVALILILLVFLRISWTLKDIHEAIVSGSAAGSAAGAKAAGGLALVHAGDTQAAQEAVVDETEIAAVIAVASAAMRAAV